MDEIFEKYKIPRMKKLYKPTYQKMKNKDINIHWWYIPEEYILSEDIIREFKDDFEWYLIAMFQNISYKFIIEFIDRMDLCDLKENENLHLTEEQWRTLEVLKRLIN